MICCYKIHLNEFGWSLLFSTKQPWKKAYASWWSIESRCADGSKQILTMVCLFKFRSRRRLSQFTKCQNVTFNLTDFNMKTFSLFLLVMIFPTLFFLASSKMAWKPWDGDWRWLNTFWPADPETESRSAKKKKFDEEAVSADVASRSV